MARKAENKETVKEIELKEEPKKTKKEFRIPKFLKQILISLALIIYTRFPLILF